MTDEQGSDAAPIHARGGGQERPPVRPSQDDVPPESASWPGVVGTISIVMASLGLLCNSCGLIGPLVQGFAQGMMPPEQQAKMVQPPPIFQPGVGDYLVMVLRLPLAALLLTAGISLVRRRLTGRSLHLIYGLSALVIGLGGLGWALSRLPGQLQWLKEHAGSLPPFTPSAGGLIGIIVITAIIELGWPTFCLIWFGKVKTDPQEIRRGVVSFEEVI